jgi:hypothetical protein
MSMMLLLAGAFLLIAVVGGMVAVFLIGLRWGSSFDRGTTTPTMGIGRPSAPKDYVDGL